ncbi:ribonuclease Z [Fibrella aestuarina]|uniref:Ribonuclease Z n=2 Tax=Fibrivirga algicola TaxID=2950420 RepID=A0ABX0QFH8_9BACT|nr:ribonuclease Z [Fibrivirga algicola]
MMESWTKASSQNVDHPVADKPSAVPFAVTILGSGSASPALDRHQTAQLVTYSNDHFLIDCGEGTQYRLIEQRARPSRLKYIFISHLHGDHYFGLMPLLSSLNMGGRTEDLYLFGPHGLDEIITTTFRVSNGQFFFPLHFQAVDAHQPAQLLDLPNLTVESIPLDHGIGCTGFLFREKQPKPKLLREKLPADIPVSVLKALKEGLDVLDEAGQPLFLATDYTTPGPKPRAYAYCSDTRYNERIIEQIQGVDLLYHEATFRDDNGLRASEVHHCTARQAGQLAQKANVGQLLIGHFSSRYKVFDEFLVEAQDEFPATELAIEGQSFTV